MHFLKRALMLIPLLVVVSFLAFVLVRLAPGSPFDKARKPASPEIERNLAKAYHLDEPLWKQYLRYLGVGFERDSTGKIQFFKGGLIRGDFGPSMQYRNHSVNDIIAQELPVSMTLGALAFGFAMGVGLPLGFLTAANRGGWKDYAGGFLALFFVCIPGLVLGPLLIVAFAIHWRWFPVAMWGSPWQAVLPTISLGVYFSGRIARLFREGMLNVMQSEFITAARAKGMSETRVLVRHAVRMAILPVVSYCGPLLADLLTGSFIIENIFRIPGIGVSLVNSSLNLDYSVVVGLAILYAALLVVMNLGVDVAYSFLDRRIRYE